MCLANPTLKTKKEVKMKRLFLVFAILFSSLITNNTSFSIESTPLRPAAHQSTMTEYDDAVYQVFSCKDVFEGYYEKYQRSVRIRTLDSEVSFEDFCNNFYQYSYSIEDYTEKMSSHEIPLQKPFATNVFSKTANQISPRSNIIKEAFPDEKYILGKDLDNSQPTPKSAFQREPIMSNENIDYDEIWEGDFLYETLTDLPTDHVAFIYEINQPSYYGNYIQTVEAVASGVNYGFLDDTRFVEKGVVIYRVYRAHELGIAGKAKDFISHQIGKNYAGVSDFFSTDVSINENNWYCSELIYAAYYSNGIDLCYGTGFDHTTEVCAPVLLTTGKFSMEIPLMELNLEIRIVSFESSFFNSHWIINVSNPNNHSLTIYYNSKMCFEDDGLKWTNLNDVNEIVLDAHESENVTIAENFFATSIAFSWCSNGIRRILVGTNLSKDTYTMTLLSGEIEES